MSFSTIISNFVDKSIELIFTKNKTYRYLGLILAFGLIIRIIAAVNLGVAADDMHFSVHAINFLNSGKLVTYDQSASLWYYLTDIFYNIFGTNQFGARFAAVLFGSLSIILVFLLTKEFSDEKTALIAALLLALSPFHIKNTMSEMDNTVMFFIIFSMLMFIKGLKSNKNLNFLISGILIGLGILTKIYSLLFIPVMIAYALYYSKKNNQRLIDKSLFKKLLIFLLIAFMFCTPSLIHNYLLYKDKGITDIMYANMLKIGLNKSAEYYSWDAGWNAHLDIKGFFFGNSAVYGGSTPTAIVGFGYLFDPEPILFIIGAIGLIYCFCKKKEFFVLSMLTLLFVFVFLASRMMLAKHYIFLLFIFIPAASIFLKAISDKTGKIGFKLIIILIIVMNLLLLGLGASTAMSHVYSKSAIEKVMEYKPKISEDSLVISDSRIYRGEMHWMLNGLNYIEASYFPELIKVSENYSADRRMMPVYFVECVADDCGWGTIKDQPEFNKSMEDMTEFFRNSSKVVLEASEAEKYEPSFPFISKKETTRFRVYKTEMSLNPIVFEAIKQVRTWFLYPIGYDKSISEVFDDYQTSNSFDGMLDWAAHMIVYSAIFFAFISIIVLYYIFINEENTIQNEQA